MSRYPFFPLTALLLAAPPALASHDVTEQVASFDEPRAAPAALAALPGSGPQQETERVASFDAPVAGAAIASTSTGMGMQQETERVAGVGGAPASRVATR